jgi:hypothetical protein
LALKRKKSSIGVPGWHSQSGNPKISRSRRFVATIRKSASSTLTP